MISWQNTPSTATPLNAANLDAAFAEKADDAATAASLALKAPLASPTFTGTVAGVSATMVGLGNVDNTADASKPVSTAQAAADTVSKARANHTGTQLAATVSDFNAAVDARISAATDSGWITTGLSWATGWSAATAVNGWQSLKYRKIGNQMWVNGVVQKSSSWTTNETMFTMPSGLVPASDYTGGGDFTTDILSGSGSVRVRSGSGSGSAFGIDLRYVLL